MTRNRTVGRPLKTLTDRQMAELETLAAVLNQEQIADFFGTSRSTFGAMLERDAEISTRYKKGRARAIADVAGGLLQRAREGDTASAIFYLKTRAGWREVQNFKHEITSDERPTFNVVIPGVHRQRK